MSIPVPRFEPDPALGPLNDSFKWFLASLPFDATPAAIKQFFSSFGTVNYVKVIFDSRTQKSKGYGFLYMLDSSGDVEVANFARSHNNRIQLMGKSNVLLQRHDHSRAQPIRKPGKQSHDDHVPVLGQQPGPPPMTTGLPPPRGRGSHYGPASSYNGRGGSPPPGPWSGGGPPSYGGGGDGYPPPQLGGGVSSYGPASSSSYGYQEPHAASGPSYGNSSGYVMGGGGTYSSMTGGYSGDSYSGGGYSTGGGNGYYAADSSGQYRPPQPQTGASYGGYSNQGAGLSYGGGYSGGTGYDSQQSSGYSGYSQQPPPVVGPPPQQSYATNSSYGPPQPLPPPSTTVRAAPPPPRQPVSTNIFLQNLPIDVTPKDVVQFLMKEHSVNVRRCTMEYDSDPNVHYCYAHIDVSTPGEASRLVDESAQGLLKFLNGNILTASFDSRPPPESGVSIPVPSTAPPPRPMPAGGGGGRGRGSRPLSREGRRNVSRPY